MSLVRFSTWIVGLALVSGCVDSTQSNLNDLAAGQKAEGFLVVKDIVADTAVSGSFLVTCAGSNGKTFQEVKTRSEVEKNRLCMPTAASSGSGGATDSAPDGQGGAVPAGKFKLSLRTNVTNVTYLKAKQNVDITANKAAYQDGLDYCVVPATISVNDLCRVSQTEFKAVGHDVTACLIAPGYLFSAHFSVNPTTVPNCK